MKNSWGFAFFADDLRAEAGGKSSLMGIYQNDLIVTGATLPIILPKLVVLIMYYEVVNTITSDLMFKVHLPDGSGSEVTMDAPFKRDSLPKIDPKKKLDDDTDQILHFRIPFTITPFLIVTEGTIKVRCYYDDGSELKLGRLKLTWKKLVQEGAGAQAT